MEKLVVSCIVLMAFIAGCYVSFVEDKKVKCVAKFINLNDPAKPIYCILYEKRSGETVTIITDVSTYCLAEAGKSYKL